MGNCGKDKSSIWCNGKKLSTFTAVDVEGDSVFAIVAINQHNVESMQGEIGRKLMCGNCDSTDIFFAGATFVKDDICIYS